MWRTVVLGVLFMGGPTGLSLDQARQQRTPPSPLEGTWEYVGTLKGQAIITAGRFVFLFGPPDGSVPMTGHAGTYRIVRDTATARITYSTDAQQVGTQLRWAIESWSADTAAYVVWNDAGQVTGRGRAVKVR